MVDLLKSEKLIKTYVSFFYLPLYRLFLSNASTKLEVYGFCTHPVWGSVLLTPIPPKIKSK